jgi:thioredoxin 1
MTSWQDHLPSGVAKETSEALGRKPEWCGPCKMITPLLDEIAREKAGSVRVAKGNVDENQSLSLKYNIRAIPALLFFKNGQLRDQVTGVTSKKDLLTRIDALG